MYLHSNACILTGVYCAMRSRVLFLLALLGVFAPVVAIGGETDQPLRLVTTISGREYDQFVVENGRISAVGAKGSVPVPQYANWKLLGNLPRSGPLTHLAPGYSIARLPAPEWKLRSVERPYEVRVAIDPDPKVLAWSQNHLKGSVAVLAWIVDHKAVRVFALDGSSVRESTIRFVATADETRGSPVFLLFRGREFVAPAPFFSENDANNGLVALHYGSGEALDAVLAKLSAPDRRGRGAQTLMHLVAAAGFPEGVDALLRAGARPDSRDRDGRTPLHYAAANGRREAVRHLLAGGADPNEVDSRRYPAFVDATIYGHEDVALDLIAAGVGQKRVRYKMEQMVQVALKYGRARVLVALLEQEGTKILKKSLEELVVENAAALRFDVVAVLLQYGAPADVATSNGTRALALAAQTNVPGYIEMMLDAGAVIDRGGPDGVTALMTAVLGRDDAAVKTLLERGADANAADQSGNTAMHLAAMEQCPGIVRLLADQGADLARKNDEGRTPLDIALGLRDADTAEALIAAGARFDTKELGLMDRLEAAIALDLGELVARAVEDDWDPETTFQGKWPLATVVDFHSALRTAQWLKENVPPVVQPMIYSSGDVDGVVRPVELEMPADPRPTDYDYAATTVKVSGLLDTDGRFLFVRVNESRDPRLSRVVLAKMPSWKFTPATKNGSPVSTRLSIPVTFPARSERVYEVSEVDLEPQIFRTNGVNVSQGWDDRFDPVSLLDQSPAAGKLPVTRADIPFGVTHPAAVLADGARLAVVRCVVERNGIASDFKIVRAPRDFSEDEARRLLHKLEFSAGKVKGSPVRTRVTVTLWL